jgi:acyl dehydratase
MSREQVHFEEVSIGDELPPLRTVFTTRHLVMFAGASTDFYELHYDDGFARAAGLEGVIVQGALKNALLGRLLYEWSAPQGRILSFGCSYRGMDLPGEELVCRGKVTGLQVDEAGQGVVEVEMAVEKADGTVTTPGRGRVALPRRGAAA